MRGFSRAWPFLVAIVVVYLVPVVFGLVLSRTSPELGADRVALAARALWSLLALTLFPLACMVLGFLAGVRLGFVWLLPVVAALLSVPLSVQYLGATPAGWAGAAIYVAIYLVFGLIGWLLGWQVFRRREAAAQ